MTEEPYTSPKRVLIVDRKLDLKTRKTAVEQALSQNAEIIVADNLEDACHILEESKQRPFDWVITRKNLEKSSQDRNRVKYSGIDLIREIHSSRYGDYTNSRIALMTHARDEIAMVQNGFDKQLGSVVELYERLESHPNTDCISPADIEIYAANPTIDWKLPKVMNLPERIREALTKTALSPQSQVTGSSLDGQSLEINASNISR